DGPWAREVMWSAEPAGLEHVGVLAGPEGMLADSFLIGVEDRGPYRLRYELRAEAGFLTRRVQLEQLAPDYRVVVIEADGAGTWTVDGREAPELDGCLDVDLGFSPLTNTLPVRRLGLLEGEGAPAELDAAWVLPGALDRPRRLRQRYTPLASRLVRYESLREDGATSFQADLPLDEAGLVLDYPGLWRRVWPA
ncbi:MAG TPA: putative glycolipid-binding domain-containing protein, partial [Solirubrobacteraceae bacterium]|nr:putative glycolipid-binding domain-containing protein [Solirubrobacteraceae bacterium]